MLGAEVLQHLPDPPEGFFQEQPLLQGVTYKGGDSCPLWIQNICSWCHPLTVSAQI